MKKQLLALQVASLFVLFCAVALAQSPVLPQNPKKALPGQYIVVYKKEGEVASRAKAIASTTLRKEFVRGEVLKMLKNADIPQSKILNIYETALQGFSIGGLTSSEADLLRKHSQVDYLEPDERIYLSGVQKSSNIQGLSACADKHISINGVQNFNVGSASFGTKTIATGRIVLTSPADACSGGDATPATLSPSDVTGPKIVMIDRGTCNFSVKAYKAQLAGAVGVIIADNLPGGTTAPSLGTGTNGGLVTIPVMSITQSAANAIKASLLAGTEVNATINYGLPDATFQCTPWGIARVGGGASAVNKRAWIIDSGIDLDHPDLDVDSGNSRSFVPNVTSANDEYGHGTHVAGTVAARNNGEGVVGVAAGAKVVAVRVFDAAGASTSGGLIAAINYVAGSSVITMSDVVNMSLGGGPSKAREDAVLALALKCRVVVSAGNDTRNVNFKGPSRIIHPNVYSVSAMDINGALASFSNFGEAVRYAAPGVGILSTYPGGGYEFLDGTSMAAPHVAGLLLLGVDLCASKRITGDKDGIPDPILTVATIADNTDNDKDGYTPCNGDLDDNDATIHPTVEICDGIDNDNDGLIDEGDVCCIEGVTKLYVNASATGLNTGLSWLDAFTSLQSAISFARKCSLIKEIRVAKGTYYPSEDEFGNVNPAWNLRTMTFSLRNGLAIYGGFEGNEDSNFALSQRNFTLNATILDGNFQRNSNATDNVYNVVRNVPVFGQKVDETAVLDGFTIRGGYGNALTSDGYLIFPFSYGGGMFNYYAGPEVRNMVFESNYAYLGGAMENNLSDAIVKNTRFNLNSGFYGAALANESSSPTIINSSFQLNRTDYDGAAVSNFYSSNPLILNSSFSGNRVSNAASGAAIYNYDASSPIISNSIVWGNSSSIYNETSTDIGVSTPQISYSIVQGLSTGARLQDNLNLDPLFVSQPVIGSSVLGNLTLQPCSPALNAGDPATGSAGSTDMNGNPRIYGNAVDMGPIELQRDPFAVSISASPGLSISSGSSVTLTAAGANSYTWSTAGVTAAISVSPSGTTEYTVTGVDGNCSGTAKAVVVVDGVPLPVSLIGFSAKAQPNGTVRLEWTTSAEKDNAFFELEKSTDLKSVDKFAQVQPLASNEVARKYSFVDELPYKGRSYYRLSQTDLDGKQNTYSWVAVTVSGDYHVFPNPVSGGNFSLKLDEPEKAVLKFFTIDGKSVDFKMTGKKDGVVNLRIPSQLQGGVYMLSVEERGQTSLHRVIIGK